MLTLFTALTFIGQLNQAPIEYGSSKIDLSIKDMTIEVFCYKPMHYTGKRMIMVFHGTLRDADAYRDDAKKMADRFGALIVAPKFDEKRFPNRKYHRGGILNEDGSAAKPSEWTYNFVPKIAKAIRKREGLKELPYTLIGHSAGAQFVMRMAGFFDSGAERIVAANPGSDLFPNTRMEFGYGFGKLPEKLQTNKVLKQYLAQPLTLYLGGSDCCKDEYFDDSPEAMEQGGSRFARGQACYKAARELAEKRGWPFNWKIVVAPGVGHDHKLMFEHAQADVALFGHKIWN